MDGPSELPSVTPSLLGRVDGACALWLRAHHLREGLARRPFRRWNVRTPLLDACRAAHAVSRRPTGAHFVPPGDLEPEEQALFRAAADGYLAIFGDQAVRSLDHGCHRPTPSARRGLEIGGAVDLLVESDDGAIELRQLELWRRPLEPDPLDAPEIRLAVLRLLRPLAALGAATLQVTHADVLAHVQTTRAVDLVGERDALVAWFDDRVAHLRRSIESAPPSPGSICGMCDWVHRCPAMRPPS